MPKKSETKMVKRKKPKQKQKQKQIVKQNVKVTVQSSGGSGGGGSSMPQPFIDKSGENVRLQSILEQISRKISAPSFVENKAPVSTPDIAASFNPANDASTFNSVFKAPMDLQEPIILGPAASGKIPKARKQRSDAGSPRAKKASPINPFSESEGEVSSQSQFQIPTMYPSESSLMAELRAKTKLAGMEPNFS